MKRSKRKIVEEEVERRAIEIEIEVEEDQRRFLRSKGRLEGREKEVAYRRKVKE